MEIDRKDLWRFNTSGKVIAISIAYAIVIIVLYLWSLNLIFNFGAFTPDTLFNMGLRLYLFNVEIVSFFQLVTIIAITLSIMALTNYFSGLIGDSANFASRVIIIFIIFSPFAFLRGGVEVTSDVLGLPGGGIIIAEIGFDIAWFMLLYLAYKTNIYTFNTLERYFSLEERVEQAIAVSDGFLHSNGQFVFPLAEMEIPDSNMIFQKGMLQPVENLVIVPMDGAKPTYTMEFDGENVNYHFKDEEEEEEEELEVDEEDEEEEEENEDE